MDVKNFLFLLTLSAVFLTPSQATPLLIVDPFNTNNGDVVGDTREFDIQKAEIEVGRALTTVSLFYNFGPGNSTLNSFAVDSIRLDTGDIFFTLGGAYAYGVPLLSHAGSTNGGTTGGMVEAGHVYQVNNSGGTMTARQALHDPAAQYRPEQVVWLRNAAGSLTDLTSANPGTITILPLGSDGVNSPKFQVNLSVSTPDALYQDYVGGLLGVSFASATCGNDVIAAALGFPPQPQMQSETAEPAPLLLAVTGLAGIGWLRRRKSSR